MNLQTLPSSGNSVVPGNENFQVLDWSTIFGRDPLTTSGLTWGYYGTASGGTLTGKWGGNSVAAGTLALTNNATNYIVVDRLTGAVSASTSATNWNLTNLYARVYKVTTVSGAVTAYEDHRAGPGGVIGDVGPAGASGSVSTGMSPATFEARLTLETGVAVSLTDQTAKATVYLTPFKGNNLSLYDTDASPTAWTTLALAEISLSLASHIKGVTYDLFCYSNAGSPTLESLAWKKVAASNSPTAGSNKVINLADTATLAVDQRVTVKDGSNSQTAIITVVTASTSITVATLANSYTTPDVYGYRARATDLATQDGVLVKSGDASRRYCGSLTIISGTTGQTEDSEQRRLVFNYYNRVRRKLKKIDSANTWNYSASAFQQADASTANQLELTQGVREDAVGISVLGQATNNTATVRGVSVGIGINRITTNDADRIARGNCTSTVLGLCHADLTEVPALGFNFYTWTESGAGADTQTWQGDNNQPTLTQSGMSGVWAN